MAKHWASARGTIALRTALIISASLICSLLGGPHALAQSSTTVTVAVPSPATGTVQINGLAKGGSVERVDISIDGVTVKSCNARQCTATWNTVGASNGQHSVRAEAVLRDGRIGSTERVVIVSNADVVPSALTLGAATVAAGGTTALQAKVTNVGTAAAQSVTATISISANGTTSKITTLSVGTLSPGTSSTIGTLLTAPTGAGTYTVTATAATSNPETNTWNNTTTATLTVSSPPTSTTSPPPMADLVPSSPMLGTQTIAVGGTTPLTLTVSNRGTATAQSVAVAISLAANGTMSQVGSIGVGTLAAGASATVATTLTAPMSPATYTVIARAATPDPEATIDNNAATATLSVSSLTTATTNEPPSASSNCNYYASPIGTGDGLSRSTPFRVSNFWLVAAPGMTLCLLDGLYQGAANMISPGTIVPGKSGTNGNPITVRAENEGAVTIDGQFSTTHRPVSLVGNDWWVFEGFNAKNGGQGDVVALNSGSDDNIFRRIVVWDGKISSNIAIVGVHNSSRNLFEDVAIFGTARKPFSGSQGGNFLTCRRCWIRWEGSINAVGGVTTSTYNSNNYTCENCILEYTGESQPHNYTDAFGGTSVSNHELKSAAGYLMQDGASPVGCGVIKWLGSIIYVKATDRTTMPGSGLLSTFYRLVDCVTVRDSIFAAHPDNADFAHLRGIHASEAVNAATVSFTNVTTLAGLANVFGGSQTRSNVVASTSTSLTGGIPTIFTGSANPWTGTTGAQICYRTVNGVVDTSAPLWPWPMNRRINAATATAGAYGNGHTFAEIGCNKPDGTMNCKSLNGTPFTFPVRTATDVTAQIEAMFGTIPAACR